VATAPVLVGDGFTLKALHLSDAEAWKAGEDNEQIKWLEAPGPSPMENIRRAIRAWQAGWADEGAVRHWGIRSDDRLAGGVELRVREDGRANLSYLVFPRWRRRGLACGAALAAATWAFENLGVTAVVAVIDDHNVASRAVAERAGFRLDGAADPSEHSESGMMLRYVLDL
jgi:RimJ/RimL family protein N-acetyltransferase